MLDFRESVPEVAECQEAPSLQVSSRRAGLSWLRRLRWRIELLGWQTLAALLWQLGHQRALRLGEMVGRLLPWVSRRRLRIAKRDLRRVFGETKTEAEIENMARQCLTTLGATLAELLWLRRATRADVDALVEFDDGARLALEQAAACGRGAILVGIHFGRWELMFLGINLSGQQFTLVARPLANPYLDTYVNRIRCKFGNSIAYIADMRSMHEALARRDTLLIAMDHHSEQQGATVNFLGQATRLKTGVARLALRHEASLLPVYALPLARGRLRITIGPILEYTTSDNGERDIQRLTQRSADVLGAVIREHPQYWMWSHKRLWDSPSV